MKPSQDFLDQLGRMSIEEQERVAAEARKELDDALERFNIIASALDERGVIVVGRSG
jgi:hypothetical protein